MLIREATDDDAEAIARLFREANDASVVSADGIRHMHRTSPERARLVVLVAEVDGGVVAVGSAGLNTWTTTEGAAWASVTVESAYRRRGIGDELGRRVLDHLREVEAKKITSFFRWTEEAERWASSRGWSRLLGGPLIAVDPRLVEEPTLPAGYRCVAMAGLSPEDVYEAVRATALDEPTPIPHDDFKLDDFLREWNEPEADLESSTAVLDENGIVVSFSFLYVGGDRAKHGFTGTVREHRGRGLAMAAKRRALRTAARAG